MDLVAEFVAHLYYSCSYCVLWELWELMGQRHGEGMLLSLDSNAHQILKAVYPAV